MSVSEPHASQGGLHRWAAPLAIIWAGLMLSAFVFERRLPEAVREAPSPMLVGLLVGLPGLSLGVLLGLRRLDAAPQRRSAPGDALVAWLLAALFAAHALVLAVVAGALPSLHPGLSLVAGVLLIGLALLLPGLPFACPFGLLTPATRADTEHWQRVHRELATGAAVSGALALGTALVSAGPWTPLALLPVVLTVARGFRAAPEPVSNEDGADPDRPSAPDEERSP